MTPPNDMPTVVKTKFAVVNFKSGNVLELRETGQTTFSGLYEAIERRTYFNYWDGANYRVSMHGEDIDYVEYIERII